MRILKVNYNFKFGPDSFYESYSPWATAEIPESYFKTPAAFDEMVEEVREKDFWYEVVERTEDKHILGVLDDGRFTTWRRERARAAAAALPRQDRLPTTKVATGE